jgi:16S rRNA (cytosine1402-N4)-methyltransferase
MEHISVLLKETIDGLAIKPSDVVFDGTLGSGGHTAEICTRYGKDIHVIATDKDADAIERSKKRLAGCTVTFVQESFRNIDKAVGETKIDKILLDLGLSSNQFDESGRGFTFRKDEPLLMTMKKNPDESDITAREIVNEWEESSIADIIYGYGEEIYARRIAKAIVTVRKGKPIETTSQLTAIIEAAVPASYRRGRLHPATKTFQAIRIAVNDELGSLTEALTKGFELLNPNGRIAIISFHSLEDRIVKRFFKEKEKEDLAKVITKRPIVPTDEEIQTNPRSRSAKLRIIEKF